MNRTKILLSFISLSVVVAAYFHYQDKNSIRSIVETNKDVEFTTEKDFRSISWAIATGKFEEEILKINNATVLEKEWTNKELHIERPLRKNRYWEFEGTMKAKIKISNDEVKEEVNITHDVKVDSNEVKIKANLDSPIEKIGLTSLEQEINITKNTDSLTKVKVSIKMKVNRLIPSFLQKYAQETLDKSAENQLQKIKEAINNLPTRKPGIYLPLK